VDDWLGVVALALARGAGADTGEKAPATPSSRMRSLPSSGTDTSGEDARALVLNLVSSTLDDLGGARGRDDAGMAAVIGNVGCYFHSTGEHTKVIPYFETQQSSLSLSLSLSRARARSRCMLLQGHDHGWEAIIWAAVPGLSAGCKS
jgi:hypothetical protein